MGSLKGTRISLRGPEPDDLDSLYLWENDASLWPYGAMRAPLSRHQIWQYIDSYDGDVFSQRQLRMMIVDNLTGRAAGSTQETAGSVSAYSLRLSSEGRALPVRQ